MRSYQDLLDAARLHRDNLLADINNASNRLEHIRLTALAQEADTLLNGLVLFGTGLVYSHDGTQIPTARTDDIPQLFES
jgi:hypothetical protein